MVTVKTKYHKDNNSLGKKVKVGEQSDINEFSINFFERIEEGLALDARVCILTINLQYLNTLA